MHTDLAHVETRMTSPIEVNDVGIVLKPDGTYRIFNCIENFDAKAMSEEEFVRGKKLVALSTALQVPAAMEFLYSLTADPKFLSAFDVNTGSVN